MSNGSSQKERADLPKSRKASLTVLLVCSIAVLLFGTGMILHKISGPFDFLSEIFERNKDRVSGEVEKRQREIISLQSKDTDGDGLSDFEEIYVYGTSAYLEDTDSDGLSDKQEVEKKEDPNCPAGQACKSPSEEGSSEAVSPPVFSRGADEIRKQLLGAGIPEDILSQVDDRTLVEVYGETVAETGIDPAKAQEGTGVPSAAPAGYNPAIPVPASDPEAAAKANLEDYFQDMSIDEIKQMLLSSGMNPLLLEQVDDDTLRGLLDQALEAQLKAQ